MAALNRTIESAPTRPKDNAKENLITVITKVVIMASGMNTSEKYSLSFKVLDILIYANLTINAKEAETKIATIKLL